MAQLFTDDDIRKLNNRPVRDFVGIISNIRNVEDLNRFSVLKFILSNDNGKNIQCNIWNDDIHQFLQEFHVGDIIRIVVAVPQQANPKFNQGNIEYILTVRFGDLIRM